MGIIKRLWFTVMVLVTISLAAAVIPSAALVASLLDGFVMQDHAMHFATHMFVIAFSIISMGLIAAVSFLYTLRIKRSLRRAALARAL